MKWKKKCYINEKSGNVEYIQWRVYIYSYTCVTIQIVGKDTNTHEANYDHLSDEQQSTHKSKAKINEIKLSKLLAYVHL